MKSNGYLFDGRLTPPRRILVTVLGVFAVSIALIEQASAQNTINVDNASQIIPSGGCSLREAIYSANFDNNLAITTTNPDVFVPTGCAAGSGDDTIVIPSGMSFAFTSIVDDAHNPFGPTATPIVFSNITIEANGATLQRTTGTLNFRAFTVGYASVDLPNGTTVSGSGNLTIRNAYIKNFGARGGDGKCGGGGGMGAGGGIYVGLLGVLTVENSTLEGNGAIGGNGRGGSICAGLAVGSPGGGGGGMGGDGGIPDSSGATGLAGAGGGGGGSRGNGADAYLDRGGSGGGTVTAGTYLDPGFRCGGQGGAFGEDGSDATCAGGGGGGGGEPNTILGILFGGNAGKGFYGGGGGGGGVPMSPGAFDTTARDGAKGGFGGGGGGCGGHGNVYGFDTPHGGKGGFGGGGGGCTGLSGGEPVPTNPGDGGFYGGRGGSEGGGGAGLGGAIFSEGSTVTIRNSTLTGNFAVRGIYDCPDCVVQGSNGADSGAAIFSYQSSLTVENSTITGNYSTGPIGGVTLDNRAEPCSFPDACLGSPSVVLTLRNTIIAHNGGDFSAPKECITFGSSITRVGSGNLIMQNDTDSPCPGVVTTADPQLGPVQINAPGNTPTMAILPTSPAYNAGDDGTTLATDQRGVTRPQVGQSDIGAYEWQNTAPVARCQDVTVSGGQSCSADAAVDNGSFDPDVGDTITLAQSPAGPYSWGETTTTLIVTDGYGGSSSCTSTVTVVDDTPPVISASLAKTLLIPRRAHDLVNVGLQVTVTDACGPPTALQVDVYGDEEDETPTDALGTVFSPDAKDIAVNSLRLRAERVDAADGRVYLIILHSSDGSGNTAFACKTVVVPHSSSAASTASVNSQAATALAYCQGNNGTPPPGHFVIGDGPVIGPKQ